MYRGIGLLTIMCVMAVNCTAQNKAQKRAPGYSKAFVSDSACKAHYAVQAQKDIAAKKVSLYAIGGIVYNVTKEDTAFEKAYKVQYNVSGCVIKDVPCLEVYNKAVFKYLDSKYGGGWRKKVKSGVIGL